MECSWQMKSNATSPKEFFFFEAFMTVGKAPTASLLPKTKGGYKRMYMG
jgi:hypothetical protein